MNIRYRILFINFIIVVLILTSSAIGFYSIMYSVLSSQQSKHLINSANDLIYAYREINQNMDDDFNYLVNNNINQTLNKSKLNNKNLDFILEVTPAASKIVTRNSYKELITIPPGRFTKDDFIKENPYALINVYKAKDGKIYYYGKILTESILNDLSRKINSNVAVVWDGSPIEISNNAANQKYLYILKNIIHTLQFKNNFEIYNEGGETKDILATIYRPASGINQNNALSFLVFNTLVEAAVLRSSIITILLTIGLTGVILSLILTMVFTDKIRKQIKELSSATEITEEGNFKNKITFKSNDELGQLAGAFNVMIDEIEKNQKAKNEYSEFITLINQNPTLKEIGQASLKKIIKTCGFTIGALYSVDEGEISFTSSHGLNKEMLMNKNPGLFNEVIKTREMLEFDSQEILPTITTGIVSLEIKYLLILPIIYNNNVIAILELGAVSKPSDEAKEYLEKIREQLAIGLTNATAFVKLENLVNELKALNEEYQKQNLQIRQQNETLVELHKELKEKADELDIQRRKAEESTQLKSQFLASMSHELRTPMNSILGLTELILEDPALKGKNRDRLQVVLNSGNRLMNLINDILDLSKIEAGKMELRDEDVMLEDLVKDVDTSISPLVLNKKIDFDIIKDIDTKIIINTDRGRVTQVLINLLGNAVKFTEDGIVALRIYSKDNKFLCFDVSDSGIGISEENQRIIFEEFRQIDGTSTRKYSGTGLGLTICKKIADLMHGSISVTSQVNSGSTFTFCVPLNLVGLKELSSDVSIDVETLIKNRTNPILIIDDDADVRNTIGTYLMSKGYEVVYAEDGHTGIEQARHIQPFAITLDLMLPGKDGWNVLKKLKEDETTKDIPVILISIMGNKNVGYGLGAFEYFIKPVSPLQIHLAFEKLQNLAKKRIEKIVIVDDDETEFEKFKRAFKNEKIRIEYIKDSEYAFNKILEVQPDLIILDLIMPNIDGITLSHKLKSNRETKHIPIILSTAQELSMQERESLYNIVEDITVKSKGHPLDVLKIVRDRIHMHELYSAKNKVFNDEEAPVFEKNKIPNILVEENNTNYLGNVLIVDDDPDTLFTINEIVEACNCKTTLAKNGVECLKALESTVPDLILLDIMMPEMDGFQTIHNIKQNPALAHIPIFAVTAKAMLEDKKIIFKHGFDDYIAKPINSGIMAFKIQKTLSKLKIG